MTRILTGLCATVFLLQAGLSAQTSAPTQFDVATIRKRTEPSESSQFGLRPGGRVQGRNVALLRMIVAAYDVTEAQIVDVPAWVAQERWDLEAKAEGLAADVRPEQIQPLLRKLLEDRFSLRIRKEMRPLPVYHLVVDRAGHKLKPSSAEPPGGTNTNSGPKGIRMESRYISMPRFAQTLSRRVDRTVVDRTGLEGNYDLDLAWTPEMALPDANAEAAGPSVFTAIREQLGLRLEPAREGVEVLVIGRAEPPKEN
jgi:uncharacterized protein (TIGR03435 family)